MKSDIRVVKINNGNLYKAMNNLVDALPFPEEAKCIGIKLNLCNYRTWEAGVTSDPAVVCSLLEILRDKYHNSKILLLENNATETLVDNLYPYLGYDIIAEKYDCALINVAHEEYTEKKINHRLLAHYRVIDQFIKSLNGEAENPITIDDVMDTMKLLDDLSKHVYENVG